MNFAPDDRVTYIGRTNHRRSDTLFGIRRADRRMHVLVVGKTGTGKTHLLKLLIEQDVKAHEGCAVFDPHGDMARAVRDAVPADRVQDLVYVDPVDASSRWRSNPFASVVPEHRSLAAAGIVDVFKKLWLDDWGPRLEHLLRNVAFTLLEIEGSTFADVPALLTDRTYRQEITRDLANPAVRDFWSKEYEKYATGFRATVIAPLQNKIGILLTDPVLRRFFTEEGDFLDFREIMDKGKMLVVNLDKGRLGEGSASVLGSLLLSHIALAGLTRSSIPETERRDYAVFLDEFQAFTTQALANMLSELRKYRISLVLATQYLGAIDPSICSAVFGNVGTIISFRVGTSDAVQIARELGKPVTPEDLIALPKYNIYLRLLIDGEPSRAFSAVTAMQVFPSVA